MNKEIPSEVFSFRPFYFALVPAVFFLVAAVFWAIIDILMWLDKNYQTAIMLLLLSTASLILGFVLLRAWVIRVTVTKTGIAIAYDRKPYEAKWADFNTIGLVTNWQAHSYLLLSVFLLKKEEWTKIANAAKMSVFVNSHICIPVSDKHIRGIQDMLGDTFQLKW